MISLPGYNFPLSFKEFVKNYLIPRSTSKFYATEPKTSVDLNKSQFLIVSDDPFTSFVFGRSIEKWNGRVHIAETDKQALEFIHRNSYRAVLVDIKDVSAEAVSLYKQFVDKIDDKSLLIALIDEATVHLKDELLQAGYNGTLDKEIEPAELSEKLREIA
ncbi:response regulator [Desertivirga brevis]|uniref:response regulator n=1 Tax=Desertivirga brevis TaxID=2810310 RepID=UPI001A95D1E0|nr:response regulator [Pedobacter sp. SYSU D00873]